ncbi:uncharacterized protein LOC142358420, partial [Convolutriloba macropyga]|uniref:uncharacterized protein LOC142358420 n=1 Tax=Convolutriloba macropyga TaxID=536237 RepID=UPI003F51CFFC
SEVSLVDCQLEYDSYTFHPPESPFSVMDPTAACQRSTIEPKIACAYWKKKLELEQNECSRYERHNFCKQTPVDPDGVTFYASDDVRYDCSHAARVCVTSEYGLMSDISGNPEFIKVLPEFLNIILVSLYQKRKHDFVFIRCTLQRNVSRSTTENYTGQQLIQFIHKPRQKGPNTERTGGKQRALPSFSVIFMDSLSRTAAYQSWPKTMDFLRDLNKENPDRVLDYRLLHSIFTGTYWNLQNLWMGSEAKGTIHDEFWYFDVKLLTQKLQKQGYAAGYISDLCFHYPWRDKDNTEKRNVRLKKFKKHLDASELNTTGITLASCEILEKAIGSFSSFTPADVCFNGDYQFIQQLDNMHNIQTNWLRHGYPFFMSTESNMNHNMGGTNVKHIDSHLEQYLRKIAKQPDVITILVADHGNRFDIHYMQKYFPEGQTDVMHPFLFIILPQNPLRFYTQSELTALKINQNRLVTMRDVHYLLAKYTTSSPDYEILSSEKGLLSPISKERRCDSLTFTKGNFFCICEPLANDSFPLRGHE